MSNHFLHFNWLLDKTLPKMLVTYGVENTNPLHNNKLKLECYEVQNGQQLLWVAMKLNYGFMYVLR